MSTWRPKPTSQGEGRRRLWQTLGSGGPCLHPAMWKNWRGGEGLWFLEWGRGLRERVEGRPKAGQVLTWLLRGHREPGEPAQLLAVALGPRGRTGHGRDVGQSRPAVTLSPLRRLD